MSEDIEVKFSGALFDGRAEEAMRKLAEDCQDKVAKAAEDTWQDNMDAAFRHPTPKYQLFVNIAHRDKDLVVNDGWPESGLKYGLWLEGVGSRNAPVTVFPGYFSLKRAGETVRRDLDAITQPIVDKYVREANG
jgi:hypothetical protein